MATTYKRIEAVNKAGEILKFLGQQKQPVPGPDIARAVNMQVGTVMCHLATLADLNFVQQVGEGWLPGMGLALLWARYKANLEGQRDRIDRDLQSISIPGGN